MRASEDPSAARPGDEVVDRHGQEHVVDEHGREHVVDEHGRAHVVDEHGRGHVVDEHAAGHGRHERVVDEDATTRRHDEVDDAAAAAPVAGGAAVAATPLTREAVVAREKERFGGMKMGSAFFGWLTATGTVVLLTALVAGAGAVLGLGSGATADEVAADAADAAAETTGSIGIAGAIAVLVILFVGYLAGGYVAGRMARFSGAKQGLGVWLWAIVIAIVLAIVSAIAGAQWNVLASLDTFPRLPIGEGELTTIGIVTAVLALVVSLGGAVLGGLAGMRFHRRVDREGLGR